MSASQYVVSSSNELLHAYISCRTMYCPGFSLAGIVNVYILSAAVRRSVDAHSPLAVFPVSATLNQTALYMTG